MSMHNRIDGPDEDEHYEVRELGHPNKSFRKMHAQTEQQQQQQQRIVSEHSAASGSNLRATRPRAGSKSSASAAAAAAAHGRRFQPPPALTSLVNSSTANISASGASLLEQVRMAKDQAIEILKLLDAESMLELDLSQYLKDVEASYNEGDPKLTFPKLRAAWTRDEDRLLMVGVKVYGPNTESWPRIAMLVPGRTNKSCRKRWFHSLDPSLHKGPWTGEEDELLRERVAQFPSQWSRVAEGIPGRTDDQCAKRWRESLDPEIDRGKWRPEEDRLLLEKFAEFGTQWQKIATFFQGRPGLHCRNRWRKIQRIINQKEKKSGPIAANDLTETLASVTESVNRRKTAQRARPQGSSGQGADKAGKAGSTELPATSATAAALLIPEDIPQAQGNKAQPHSFIVDAQSNFTGNVGGLVAFEQHQQHQQAALALQQSSTPSQEQQHQLQLQAPSLNIQTDPGLALASIVGPADNSMNSGGGSKSSSQAGIHSQSLTPTGQQQQQQQQSGVGVSSESIGALYMPSEQSPASATFVEGSLRPSAFGQVVSGAKRSASVLFSPTDEQRQRLRKLGLKLYGCAAAPEACNASFADSLSLNSHLKLAHPSIAYLIPSLHSGAGGSGSGPSNMAAECAVSAQLPAGDGGALKGGISRAMLKPYRCAMAGCNHQYKNVNGLEYHIFHSRKSDNHLLMGTAGRSATDSNEGGGSSGGTPDAPMAEHSPMVDTPLNDSVPGSALGLADSLSAPFNQQPPGGAVAVQGVGSPADMAGGAGSAGFLLQCTEVECLASFTSEHKLRQHMATQHPRPIRRATKPSYRVKSGRNNPGAATMDSPSSSSSFWNSANLSDVLSAAAANMDATGNSQVGAMPTIPEGEVSASNEATVAAIAAAIGYGDARGVSTPGVAGLTTLDQAAASVSRQLPSSLLFQAGISATPGAFNPTSPSFMSAPALISVTGGEPTNAGSYFALNMSSSANAQQHQHQQQPAPHPHQLTQALLGNPHSADAIAGTPGISMAPASAAAAASVMLAAMNQAAAAQAGSQSFNLQGSSASGAADPSSRGDESGGAEAFASHYLREMGVDSLSLDMQLVQSMLSPFYTQTPNNAGGSSANGNEGSPARAPAMGFAKLSAEGAGDVDMEDTRNGQYHYPRSQRSDSIDLSSLATMPTSIGPAANSSDAVSEAADPSISTSAADSIPSVSTDGTAQSAQSTQQQQYSANSGAHSQIAATLMSKRNAQQQLQQQQGAAPWMQDLSALGLLSIPKDDSGGHALQANLAQQQLQQPQQRKRYVLSAHAGDLKSRRDWHVLQQEQQQQQIYTPQPLDVTHFQQQQQQPRHGFAQNMGPATIPIGTRYHRQFMQPFPFPQTQAGDAPSLVAQQPGNSIIRCPLPMCGQGFSDANALKHHLSFDHPHDDATMLPRSHPGSPEDGFLSTLPIHGTLADGTDSGSGKQAKPSSGSMANAQLPYVGRSTSLISMVADPLNSGGSAMPLPQQQAGASSGSAATGGGGDRTKAPHWVDPNLWSMWIAAANGQGDITAAAAATAMGITPGVVGPQTFLPSHPASSPQQFSQHQQQQHSENELLRMFESLPSENSQQQQLSLDQQIAMAESVLSNHISAPVSSAAGAQPSVRAPLLAKSISHRPPQA